MTKLIDSIIILIVLLALALFGYDYFNAKEDAKAKDTLDNLTSSNFIANENLSKLEPIVDTNKSIISELRKPTRKSNNQAKPTTPEADLLGECTEELIRASEENITLAERADKHVIDLQAYIDAFASP